MTCLALVAAVFTFPRFGGHPRSVWLFVGVICLRDKVRVALLACCLCCVVGNCCLQAASWGGTRHASGVSLVRKSQTCPKHVAKAERQDAAKFLDLL